MPPQKSTLKAIVKIAIVGPESSGKSTLAQQLAAHFNAPFVAEFARTYLEAKPTPGYHYNDLETIAAGQLAAIKTAVNAAEGLVFFDTDLITLHIWSLDKFDRAIPLVEENLHSEKADLYLVCTPDLPWQADPLREDSARRDELFDWNLWVLNALDARVEIVSGVGEARLTSAVKMVTQFLENRLSER